MAKLAAIGIRNLKQPGRYSDGNGLILDIGKSGRGSWIVRVQVDGRRRDIGLGSLSSLSLAQAREAAAQIRREAKAGIDVVAARKREQNIIPTFREAALKVHAEHKAAWKNGKHQAQWMRTLEVYVFPAIGDSLVGHGCNSRRSSAVWLPVLGKYSIILNGFLSEAIRSHSSH
ncbi:MAG: DUF4102 domain-containing protein [Sphingomonadales bacterium]|jgi:hypothetical protein|nr:DUF4102 domain-containing protein [Sphingomonadales bacterium]MBK9002380.1 DUF4102 domain-containing protein [Sphingomonadales bacterium]MBK9267610.1 DUF4102 domain-containing protein [Sphingomonadales bacterium]MBP6433164.1 DUF4102 domain-containing protein [Sphingorhabdus sp.]